MFPNHPTSLSQQLQDFGCLNAVVSTSISPHLQPQLPHSQKMKKKRSLPGNPDPEAEVIALSPKTMFATNRFVCEICNKGFQRDQNLQLHRRGHNLPWKLKQRSGKEARKRAYVSPEASCVHHHPSRALGDLTGIKKHYFRKHGEKKWKCDKCSKIYAVYSDWKAHSKTCGTREYRCDCGTLFSRKDSFITHRAFCDALAEESARISPLLPFTSQNPNPDVKPETTPSHHYPSSSLFQLDPKPVTPPPFHTLHGSTHLSTATQLNNVSQQLQVIPEFMGSFATCQKNDRFTRDFLGLDGDHNHGGGGGVSANVSINVGDMQTYAGGIELQQVLLMKPPTRFRIR